MPEVYCPPCPACSGTGSAKDGTKLREVLDLAEDGTPLRAEIVTQRWRCPSCGHRHSTLPADLKPRSLATMAARDAVAEACFLAGYAGAATRFGIDEKTARALWDDWADVRASDLPDRPPEALGLFTVRLAGGDRTLIVDTQNHAVVDLLPDAEGASLIRWFDRIDDDGAVSEVVIGFHPVHRDVALTRFPTAPLRIRPEHAEATGLRAFLSAFRAVRRGAGGGRNVREAPRIFATAGRALEDSDAEGMEAWDDTILSLYQAKERFLAALASRSVMGARTELEAARQLCLAIPGAAVPAALIATWGDEIAAGCELGRNDPFPDLLQEMALAWSKRRPPLPFDLLRGLAILRDGPRAMLDRPGSVRRNLGVPMNDITAALQPA